MNNKIQIINGPNLNLLGKREPKLYGNKNFNDFFEDLLKSYSNVDLHYFQSNHEGSIIDKLQDVGFRYDGIVLNAGALTHYSYAIADTLRAIDCPVVEVHITDIFNREDFRRISVTKEHCIELISGQGLDGYRMGIDLLLERINDKQ